MERRAETISPGDLRLSIAKSNTYSREKIWSLKDTHISQWIPNKQTINYLQMEGWAVPGNDRPVAIAINKTNGSVLQDISNINMWNPVEDVGTLIEIQPTRGPWATSLTWETSSNQWIHLSKAIITNIGQVVLEEEEIFKFRECIFSILLFSP